MTAIKLFLSLMLSLSLTSGPVTTQQAKIVYVYLCEGPYSAVYHKSDHCRGLSHCSTQIDTVTLGEAQRLGRRPCKLEYR